jgi:hypothetical protein
MSPAENAAMAFVILVTVVGVGIVAWGLWVGFWGLFDRYTGNHRRIRNSRIDMSVGRDVYRDVPGIHK